MIFFFSHSVRLVPVGGILLRHCKVMMANRVAFATHATFDGLTRQPCTSSAKSAHELQSVFPQKQGRD